jgi:hypothetical protein
MVLDRHLSSSFIDMYAIYLDLSLSQFLQADRATKFLMLYLSHFFTSLSKLKPEVCSFFARTLWLYMASHETKRKLKHHMLN